jgi:hypothetical protein
MEIFSMIQKFLGMLSGKKTNIGAILMILAQFAEMNGANEWSVVIEQLITIMGGAGLGIGTVGIFDKGRKLLKGK